jgi:hypothetical protein
MRHLYWLLAVLGLCFATKPLRGASATEWIGFIVCCVGIGCLWGLAKEERP